MSLPDAELEYSTNMERAYLLLRVLADIPVDDMLNQITRAETIGPIVDPTLYQQNRGRMMEDREVLRQLSSAARFAREIVAKAKL